MPHTFGNEPPRTEPLRWPLLVTLVVVLLAAVVGLILGDVSEQAEVAPKTVATRGLSQPLSPALPRGRPGATTPSMLADDSRTADAAKPAADEVEVCGLGFVKVSEQDPAGSGRIPQAQRTATQERLWTSLQSSSDERVRAAGWLLESRQRSARTAQAQRADTPAARSAGPDVEQASRPIDELARLAAASRDPIVYRLAMEGCHSPSSGRLPAPACQMLNAEQWTRLDPDNAIPWMTFAAVARERGDAAAEAEAMYRASIAGTSNAHWGALPRIVAQALPSDLPTLGKTIAISDAWEMQGVVALPLLAGAREASQFCSSDTLRDSNRRQTCERLADVLADKGKTSVDVNIGWSLRERLGWPKDKVQAMRDEQQALLDASGQHLSQAGELSCEGVQRMTQWAQLTDQLGELGAAREVFRRSGGNLAQATREWQQRREAARLPVSETTHTATNGPMPSSTTTATTASTAAVR
jgi:hypothetical protein